jgi:hypothetical protein
MKTPTIKTVPTIAIVPEGFKDDKSYLKAGDVLKITEFRKHGFSAKHRIGGIYSCLIQGCAHLNGLEWILK